MAYGTYPFIGYWVGTDNQFDGCLIYPSEDQPAGARGQAAVFLRPPAALKSDALFVFRADKRHLAGMASTLRFSDFATPTPPPTQADGAWACQPASANLAHPPDYLPRGMTITEYAITSAGCGPYDNFDVFQGAIPREAIAALHRWQEARRTGELAKANAALAPFGYRLEATNPPYPLYDVYRGATVVITDVTSYGPLTVNRTGDDFALWLGDANHGERTAMLVRSAAVKTLDWTEAINPPDTVYVGNDLISLAWHTVYALPGEPSSQLEVLRNGAAIYTLAIPPFTPGGGPVRGLTAWGDHWVLEADNVVVLDGEILNTKLGYDEIFNWQLLGGKPFYFFRQGRQVGLSYDSQVLPDRYDDVLHGFLCCDPAVYNIWSSSAGVWFYGLREGVWRRVFVGTSKPN